MSIESKKTAIMAIFDTSVTFDTDTNGNTVIYSDCWLLKWSQIEQIKKIAEIIEIYIDGCKISISVKL